ncbi:MAG: glycosyltransferase family 39 protein [Candidatus Daviesbacteria bacterium]|nr:glycosyltransferase family 39 protein [Candidatus Daviesbacteria bacterium]
MKSLTQHKIKLALILVILLAAILRLVNLANFPAGLNADEAAIGYNAYSLIHTGKDEYGATLPLTFKSFGDYKPGLYFYFVAPFVALLGLNEWAVRIPAALFSIATVLLIYLLGKKVFNNEAIGLLAAFLLSISPWHLQFSRGGWESNVATFFITLGVYLFINGLEKPKFFIWSLISFILAMYIYQSPRLTVPLLILGLLIYYRKHFLNLKIKIKVILLIVGLLVLPVLWQFSGGGTVRFSGLSFLSDLGPVNRTNQLIGEHSDLFLFSKLIHNKITTFGPVFLGHYLDHFKSDFLFINGDEVARNKIPETGQLYLIEMLFLLMGIFYLMRDSIKNKFIIFWWLLTAPLASALTFQTPSALRSLTMVIPLTLILALGLYKISVFFKPQKVKILLISCMGLIILFEFTRYLFSYYLIYPKRYPLAFEYGFSEMVQKLNKYEGNYQKVVITDRYDQPYILVLFYKQYNPAKYQPQAKLSPRDQFNFGTIRAFDKYEFREPAVNELTNKNTLFIMSGEKAPKDVKIIDQVNFPNGEPAFIFIDGGK